VICYMHMMKLKACVKLYLGTHICQTDTERYQQHDCDREILTSGHQHWQLIMNGTLLSCCVPCLQPIVKRLVAVTGNVLPLPLLLSGSLLLPVFAFSAFVKRVVTLVAQADACVLSLLVLNRCCWSGLFLA